MKKVIAVFILLIVFLIVCYCIPATVQKQISVSNTFQNIITSVATPENWTRWDPDVQQAWTKDSVSCHFSQDQAAKVKTIRIPDNTIRITTHTYLLYEIAETKNGSDFSLSITPYVGNGQPRSQHNSIVDYAWRTRLLYKWFPFLDRPIATQTLQGLVSYLEDNERFYGFRIALTQATDPYFLTQRVTVPGKELFKRLPEIFSGIEQLAKVRQCRIGARNISFIPTGTDSLDILTGLNIERVTAGNDHYGFMELPAGQILAVGYYRGAFSKRAVVYAAMERYLLDHQLIKKAASYEKYLSPIPASDSSLISIELSYPLRY